MAKKFNPFRPGGLVSPGMFAGRLEEIEAIEQFLFQTKNENPQHFLIQGERGIGKSSLLYYVDCVAKGGLDDILGETFKFLNVSADLGSCISQFDIIQKIGRGFRSALQEHQAVREQSKELWEWITNWEILGIKYNKESTVLDPDLIVTDLVESIAGLHRRNPDLDGTLILIDEADRPLTDANLGGTLKMFSERLEKKGCSKVVIGMAGLPTIIEKLRASHDSSPRLFHTMLLEPLEIGERKSVVNRGIELANTKNSAPTVIDNDALEYLAHLSEGYPHFVQQFAYSAFDEDNDDKISIEDVAVGAYKDGGALAQLGDKYFNEMYHARIASDDYRRVLDAMAEYGDGWVSRKKIIEESDASSTNVDNALKTLKAKEIILHDDTQRGLYRLPTKSFAAWIKAVRAKRGGQSD